MKLRQPAKDNISGFTVVEVLLIVLMVTALAGTGIVVYQRQKAASTQNHAMTSSAQSAKQHVQTVTYLDIKEWGVKLPLPDTLKGAYYVPGVSSKGSDGITDQVWIGLKSLDGFTGCAPTEYIGPALLFRASPTDVDAVTNNPYTQEYPSGVVIGGYFYAYEDFTTGGSNTCTAPQATLQTLDSALTGAVQELVSDTTNTNVVKVPELGISLTVPDSIKDLTYKVEDLPSKNGSQSPTAYFSTVSLTAADANCGPGGGPLGALGRSAGQYPTLSQDPSNVLDYGHLVRQFPTFYITEGIPNGGGCSTPASAGSASAATTINGHAVGYKIDFENSLSTIQPLN